VEEGQGIVSKARGGKAERNRNHIKRGMKGERSLRDRKKLFITSSKGASYQGRGSWALRKRNSSSSPWGEENYLNPTRRNVL